MDITAQMVKELRQRTGAGILECKNALGDTDGDMEKAVELLRKKGIAKAEKKVGRAAKEGIVFSYIHHDNKLGVLVEVNCETDFVARTDDFKNLVQEISLQIATMSPKYISKEEVNEETLAKEKEIYKAAAIAEGKPENVAEKIAEGKINKYFKEYCLLEQSYFANGKITINDLIKEAIGKIGENIKIRRFVRFKIGEDEGIIAGK